jgi:type IV pilus assembly protein PilC
MTRAQWFGPPRVTLAQLALVTRQLSVMVSAGVPLVQCLDGLVHSESHAVLRQVLSAVCRDIESGLSLEDALARHPTVFSTVYTRMVAAGEAGGRLDVVLARLADYLEVQTRMQAQVRAALVYPVTVSVVAVVVVLVLMWKVVPTFAGLFAGLDAALPWPTRFVMETSRLVVGGVPMVLAFGIAGLVAVRRYVATPQGRTWRDRQLLALPVVGVILRKAAIARCCRTLGTLLGAGVPILTGFDITARTAGNVLIERAILAARARVEHGATMAGTLRASGVVPPLVVQMVAAGEMTGAVDTMLGKIADFYEDEVESAVAAALSLLEPVLIVGLGVIIGGTVIAMYLPLFELINRLST